jgi:hypothetical protein
MSFTNPFSVSPVVHLSNLFSFRIPNALGGLYFSFNTLIGQVWLWTGIIIHWYGQH